MKVSVLMITYNHEEFIAQALDSVLMQQVNFDYEIVVGEDCSTDNTRDILIGYQQKHPDKIRLLLPEKNLGMHENFFQTFKACKGNYIALLEGDDYWISPQKLQKQIDFLDHHQNCSFCFTNALIISHNNSQTYWMNDYQTNSWIPPKEKQGILTLEDLIKPFNPIITASVTFRHGLIKEFPIWLYNLGMLDWLIHILNAQFGDIGHIDEITAAYRVHSGGIWSQKNKIENLLGIAKMYEYLKSNLDLKWKNKIGLVLSEIYQEIATIYLLDRDKSNARNYQ